MIGVLHLIWKSASQCTCPSIEDDFEAGTNNVWERGSTAWSRPRHLGANFLSPDVNLKHFCPLFARLLDSVSETISLYLLGAESTLYWRLAGSQTVFEEEGEESKNHNHNQKF